MQFRLSLLIVLSFCFVFAMRSASVGKVGELNLATESKPIANGSAASDAVVLSGVVANGNHGHEKRENILASSGNREGEAKEGAELLKAMIETVSGHIKYLGGVIADREALNQDFNERSSALQEGIDSLQVQVDDLKEQIKHFTPQNAGVVGAMQKNYFAAGNGVKDEELARFRAELDAMLVYLNRTIKGFPVTIRKHKKEMLAYLNKLTAEYQLITIEDQDRFKQKYLEEVDAFSGELEAVQKKCTELGVFFAQNFESLVTKEGLAEIVKDLAT